MSFNPLLKYFIPLHLLIAPESSPPAKACIQHGAKRIGHSVSLIVRRKA